MARNVTTVEQMNWSEIWVHKLAVKLILLSTNYRLIIEIQYQIVFTYINLLFGFWESLAFKNKTKLPKLIKTISVKNMYSCLAQWPLTSWLCFLIFKLRIFFLAKNIIWSIDYELHSCIKYATLKIIVSRYNKSTHVISRMLQKNIWL